MSEDGTFKRYRSRHEHMVREPDLTGLRCPACRGSTVERDVSSDDGYYVEFCSGGTVTVSAKDFNGKIIEGKFIQVSCEYWGTGFVRKRN